MTWFNKHIPVLFLMTENDDTIVRGGGGGQIVMIVIIIDENDDDSGQPLSYTLLYRQNFGRLYIL